MQSNQFTGFYMIGVSTERYFRTDYSAGFFKDVLISKKQSNIDSLKISLTLPFRLNSSKWKTLYWVEYYVNCYVYFNCLLLQTWTKYLRQTLVFMWNSAKTGKVQFFFSINFLVVITKFFWGSRTGH